MRFAVVCGALSGFIAMVLTAWAAHGLSTVVSPEDLERIVVGTRMQLWHALALLAVGALAAVRPARMLDCTIWVFVLGTALFSGTLYLRAFSGSAVLSFLTPIGGTALMAGWLLLAWYGFKQCRQDPAATD